MNDQKKGKQSEVSESINPVVVAVAGAVVGAGIAVAGVVLSDEKNRKKIQNRILTDKEKVKKVVASAKNSLDKTTKEVNNAVKSL